MAVYLARKHKDKNKNTPELQEGETMVDSVWVRQ